MLRYEHNLVNHYLLKKYLTCQNESNIQLFLFWGIPNLYLKLKSSYQSPISLTFMKELIHFQIFFFPTIG